MINIKLVLTDVGVHKFLTIPTFKNLLTPTQLNNIKVGDNLLTVNPTAFGNLQRVVKYCPTEMFVMQFNPTNEKEQH